MSVDVKESPPAVAIKAENERAPIESSGRFVTALRDIRLLLIALWLGGAVFFSATVAPSAFGVLRARNVPYANEAAGSIVTRTLSVVNTSGFIIALLLLASAFLYRRNASRRAFLTEVSALGVICVATGVGQWLIAARMLALRVAMNRPIDDVPVGDPLRVSFNSLHGYSVTALAVAIIAAATALLLIARRVKKSPNMPVRSL
jgi:hypothetical protein